MARAIRKAVALRGVGILLERIDHGPVGVLVTVPPAYRCHSTKRRARCVDVEALQSPENS
eukprot:14840651-Alexandrium_andersonii.AAC.2